MLNWNYVPIAQGKRACLCSHVTEEAEVGGHPGARLVSSNFRPLWCRQLHLTKLPLESTGGKQAFSGHNSSHPDVDTHM